VRTSFPHFQVGVGENHRGFGFVDYLSRSDARRAFDALVHSTHLYGRRLVLEWAKEEENMEEMREKARDQLRLVEMIGGLSRLFSSGTGDKKAIGKQRRRIEAIEKDLTVIDDD
jgi:RNA recognition motif-containing protein